MANNEIREAISRRRLRHYEVAERMGVSEYTLCKWLRQELPEDKKKQILEIIRKIEI